MVSSSVASVPKTMQAVQFYAPGDIRLEAVSTPLPGHGELLIHIEVALTDGTDLKAFRRGHPVLLGENYPAPFGHECIGRVVAVGDGLSEETWLGKRVLPANSAPCLECAYCDKARYSQCESLKLLNGAYADYLVLPASIVARNTYVLPEEVPALQVATAEPLAVCLKGLADTGVREGNRLAIIGTGPIALIWAILLKQRGCHVTLLGRDLSKLAAAQAVTAADVGLLLTEALDNAYDVVVDATGQPECWERAVELVNRGGIVQLFGGCPRGTTMTLSTERLHYDEIRLVSSFHHTPEHFKAAVTMLSRGEIDLRFLIRHELPLSSVHEAFKLMDDGVAHKIALWPQRVSVS